MAKPDIATCVGCQCTDVRACPGGCSWLAVNRDDGNGVCSCCPKSLAGWRAQQVEQRKPAGAGGDEGGELFTGGAHG